MSWEQFCLFAITSIILVLKYVIFHSLEIYFQKSEQKFLFCCFDCIIYCMVADVSKHI